MNSVQCFVISATGHFSFPLTPFLGSLAKSSEPKKMPKKHPKMALSRSRRKDETWNQRQV